MPVTNDTTISMRQCIGSARFGIEAHEAPGYAFPVQPSAKDGLVRMCHTHCRQYTNALRKAAVARKAEEPTETVASLDGPEQDVPREAPAHEHTLAASLVGESEPIEALASRRTRRRKPDSAPEGFAG